MTYSFAINDFLPVASNPAELRVRVNDYLHGEGNNSKLALHLRSHQDATVIFKEFELDHLKRSCGPEDSMLWQETPEAWETRVAQIKKVIEGGIKVPPIIVTDFWNDMHVSDGNHRHGALAELGNKRYWTLFFLENPRNIDQVMAAEQQ